MTGRRATVPGGSGLAALVQSPDGDRVAAVSARSVHVFTVPGLTAAESWRHGAVEPGGAVWDAAGVRVGGADGMLHERDVVAPGSVVAVSGFGERRAALHGEAVAAWRGDTAEATWPVPPSLDVAMDRDGRLFAVTTEDGRVVVLDARTGATVLDGGRVEVGSVTLGGTLVAAEGADLHVLMRLLEHFAVRVPGGGGRAGRRGRAPWG